MTDISKYYEQICQYPMLTREEEFDLFLELQDDSLSDKKKRLISDKIIRSNLRFVFKQAKYHSKNHPEVLEELISAGNEGLVVGMTKYKPSPAIRFLTYAGFWINQRILDHMANMRIVSLPKWKQQLYNKIQRYINSLDGVLPSLDELKKQFPEISDKYLKELSETGYLTFSIEDVDEDPSLELECISNEVIARIDRERILQMVNNLNSPHKEIVLMSFGMLDDRPVSTSGIAQELNLPKDKVRLFKKEALELLKSGLSKDYS